MSEIAKTIVVGLDASRDGHLGLDWAIDTAVRREVPLRVVHAVVPPFGGMPAVGEAMYAAGGRLLAAARERAERAGLAVSTEMMTDEPARVLTKLSQSAGTIVLGARGHGVAYGLWIGSVSQNVARAAHCPVVVIRPPADPDQPRIVVGVDGSAAGRSALRWALAEADRRGVPLTAVHGWRDHSAATFGTQSPVWNATVERIEAGDRLVRGILSEHLDQHPTVKVLVEAVPVHPARLLADASEHAALVVVGARGGGGVDGLRMGSVSQAVLHHARCPVAVIR